MSCKKARGKRAKTRSKLTRREGKATVNILLAKFNTGEIVLVDIRPEIHSGLPDAIYQGVVGNVVGQRGKAYIVDVHKGNSPKQLLVHPAHLKRLGGGSRA
ncbi:MAG: 50S ribosomal protein L21e [Candidatus Diapherotrites archaeon]|nr:50S ribosomal protein L21e [Candidatus Diapherotrites archaeon]